jgi:hypothetical protein
MRARDVRAIAFCVVTTAAVLIGSAATLHNYPACLGLTVAWAAFVLTRPRMIRVFRRLRGEPDWSGYFDEGGRRFTVSPGRSEPERPASSPRPAERR